MKSVTNGAALTRAHLAVKVGDKLKPACGPGSKKRWKASEAPVTCRYCLRLEAAK